ncbi:MAG: hypothetical protein AB2A00_31040 [Myxococcota bacterium]
MRDRQDLLRDLQLRHLTLAALLLASLPARAQETPPAGAAPSSTETPADPRPRVLVLPYRVDPRVPVEPATADAILVARMSKVGSFKIISEQELARVAGYHAQQMQLGVSEDVEGLLQLGRMAQADRLVSGTLGDVGGTTAATLVFINVHTAEVEKRVSGTAKGERDLILPLLNQQADAMLAHMIRTYGATAEGPKPAPQASAAPAPAPTAAPVSDEKKATAPKARVGVSPFVALASSAFTGGLGFALSTFIAGALIYWFAPGLRPTVEQPGPLAVFGIAGGVATLAVLISGVALLAALIIDNA